MSNPRLSLAISHYDRYYPLFDGTASPEGFDLDVYHVGQSNPGRYGNDRHGRMLRKDEFDIAELSLSSYLMARDRGMPFTAIPVFPRRLFSQSQIWINGGAGIKEPKDLIGKRVGLNTFQTTLSVLAKGDLQAEHGVPWRSIEWWTSKEETVDFDASEGVRINQVPKSTNLGEMLMKGEIDAIFRPHPPRQVLDGTANIVRLFQNPKEEESRYYKKNGFFPIMHIIAFRNETLKAHAGAREAVFDMFKRMNAITAKYLDDPNWSRLAWGRHHLEEERRMLGPDLWPDGIDANRANLERFMGYSVDQGLMSQKLDVDGLFEINS
ncbi:MAG: 4,5-dihydroxyphthalate decarboxylase [Pseudomonadota bacterium]|jgi:4,5-dihydroxyphthalate decarboxylase